MRLLGVDPGLNHTGWGIVDYKKGSLSFVAAGTISPPSKSPLTERLLKLKEELSLVISTHCPIASAVEETFVNKSGTATLKLGQARGALMLTLAMQHLPVSEYSATQVKKAVTGSGHAGKEQIAKMVTTLLPASKGQGQDALDALAVAICHSQFHRIDALASAVR